MAGARIPLSQISRRSRFNSLGGFKVLNPPRLSNKMKVNIMINLIKRAPQDIEAAHKKVLISRDKANTSTIELCYRLYHLNSIAKESNVDLFWLEHFDVVNFTEYCERKLDINPNLGSQYLMAARTIEALKPHYLESIFDSNDEKQVFPAIGYTRFRAVYKFVPMILKMKGMSKFTRLINLIFDPEETTNSVCKEVHDSVKSFQPKRSKGDLPSARLKKIESLRKRLDKVFEDVKDFLCSTESDLIDNLYEEIKMLLIKPLNSLNTEGEVIGFDEPVEGEVPQVRHPEWMYDKLDSKAEARADEDLAVVLPGFN